MRDQSKHLFLPLIAVGALSLIGCEADDVGTACSPDDPTAIGETPIGGEQPWIEVVRMKRDGACDSFRCLRHEGLSPYCTRVCEQIESEDGGGACKKDEDCTGDQNCADDGTCQLDDCPAGFKCIHVQPVGPLAENSYCVRRVECEENLDCRSLGTIDCVEHACYDKCNALEQGEDCAFREKICEPVPDFLAHMECSCATPTLEFAECFDEETQCKATDSPASLWPAGSAFERVGVCLAKQTGEADTEETGSGGTSGEGGAGGGTTQ